MNWRALAAALAESQGSAARPPLYPASLRHPRLFRFRGDPRYALVRDEIEARERARRDKAKEDRRPSSVSNPDRSDDPCP